MTNREELLNMIMADAPKWKVERGGEVVEQDLPEYAARAVATSDAETMERAAEAFDNAEHNLRACYWTDTDDAILEEAAEVKGRAQMVTFFSNVPGVMFSAACVTDSQLDARKAFIREQCDRLEAAGENVGGSMGLLLARHIAERREDAERLEVNGDSVIWG